MVQDTNLSALAGPIAPARLMSVDALRGFTMFWITGGDAPLLWTLADATQSKFLDKLLVQFEHVPWEGFHAWDLIMPMFLFVVGVVMPFSFNSRLQRGQTKKQIYLHVIKRFVILWVLGMIAQGNLLDYDLSKLHIYCNTLHAIAAGYLIASILILNLNIIWQAVVTAAPLLLFWGLMMLVPVPGYGAGVLTESGNLAIYIDEIVLGRFIDGTPYAWVLGSMTFACTVMLGVFAGHILRSQQSNARKVLWLFVSAIVCLVVGWLWGFIFPIIKHLWTSSMVLYAGGWSLLLLAIFYLLIDVWGFKKWAFPFVVIGMNAIALYTAVHIFDFKHIGNVFVGGLADRLGDWNPFVQAVAAFVVVWLILYWMYRQKVFIKV
jgi:predicted acyltransferase